MTAPSRPGECPACVRFKADWGNALEWVQQWAEAHDALIATLTERAEKAEAALDHREHDLGMNDHHYPSPLSSCGTCRTEARAAISEGRA